MQIKKTRVAIPAVLMALAVGHAVADEVQITAAATAFKPEVVFVKPGDTVKWTTMAAHDTASIEGMIPEGAQPWQSKMGEDFTLTLEKEGAYIYKCSPHVSLGMAGAIVVGEDTPANLEQIKSHPENKGMVGRVIKKLEKELEAKQAQK